MKVQFQGFDLKGRCDPTEMALRIQSKLYKLKKNIKIFRIQNP